MIGSNFTITQQAESTLIFLSEGLGGLLLKEVGAVCV